jgi:hypothetical protein
MSSQCGTPAGISSFGPCPCLCLKKPGVIVAESFLGNHITKINKFFMKKSYGLENQVVKFSSHLMQFCKIYSKTKSSRDFPPSLYMAQQFSNILTPVITHSHFFLLNCFSKQFISIKWSFFRPFICQLSGRCLLKKPTIELNSSGPFISL